MVSPLLPDKVAFTLPGNVCKASKCTAMSSVSVESASIISLVLSSLSGLPRKRSPLGRTAINSATATLESVYIISILLASRLMTPSMVPVHPIVAVRIIAAEIKTPGFFISKIPLSYKLFSSSIRSNSMNSTS